MTGGHGGRRSRSGPRPDPKSERSDKRATAAEKAAAKKAAGKAADAKPTKSSARSNSTSASPTAGTVLGKRFGQLPRAGYAGRPPTWPLNQSGNSAIHEREQQVWKEVWRTPQAAAWATEPWRWRAVAMYVRWSVRMEQGDASAATATAAIRLADQIGLTPNGMRDNDWEVEEAPGSRAAAQAASGSSPSEGAGGGPTVKPAGATAMQQRLSIVKGNSAGT